jgi:hypothetical protein
MHTRNRLNNVEGYKFIVCGTVKKNIPPTLYNHLSASSNRRTHIEESSMSHRSRAIYLTLLSGSLLFAWSNIRQLPSMSLYSQSRLWLIGAGELIFAFVITKATQLLIALDASLLCRRLAGFLAPLMPGSGVMYIRLFFARLFNREGGFSYVRFLRS